MTESCVTDRPARGILDTSTLLLLRRLSDPSQPLITAIMLAELSVGPLVARDERERAARQAHLQQAEADFEPLPFDRAAARASGRVAASLRRSGRKRRARAYDVLIAATAMANELPLYTCNPSDFGGIDDLTVVAVSIAEQAPATRATSARRLAGEVAAVPSRWWPGKAPPETSSLPPAVRIDSRPPAGPRRTPAWLRRAAGAPRPRGAPRH